MGMTAVYVTHDQAEAMALATRIAVMDHGRIVQFAPPVEIYRRPATTFVANFVGNPPMNMIPVAASVSGERLALTADGLTLAGLPLSQGVRTALTKSSNLTLGVRPEHLTLSPGEGTIAGKLFANENMGPESLVTLERNDGSRITARLFTDEHVSVGEDVRFGFSTQHVTLFAAEGRRIPADGEAPL
jgi:ABC-type sugar transport system ATPase subunit